MISWFCLVTPFVVVRLRLLIARVASLGRSTATCGTGYLQHPRPQCRIPAKKSVYRRPGTPGRSRKDSSADHEAFSGIDALRGGSGETGLLYDGVFAPAAFDCSARLRAGDHRTRTGHG